MRRTRSASLRVGAARGLSAPPRHREDPGLVARRCHDVPVPLGRRPCDGCSQTVLRRISLRRIRCRPGRGGGTCRRTRARCCGLCDQSRACGGYRRRDRRRGTARVPLAARTAPGPDSRPGSGRSAVAQPDLLVSVRRVTAETGNEERWEPESPPPSARRRAEAKGTLHEPERRRPWWSGSTRHSGAARRLKGRSSRRQRQ